mmetsp:Transcript_17791/g.58526  ORF Transcript_17791/g.58526 Transcript_17791/m.58526 type:complete len:316 (-) Transcript_17791:1475-2422(-)
MMMKKVFLKIAQTSPPPRISCNVHVKVLVLLERSFHVLLVDKNIDVPLNVWAGGNKPARKVLENLLCEIIVREYLSMLHDPDDHSLNLRVPVLRELLCSRVAGFLLLPHGHVRNDPHSRLLVAVFVVHQHLHLLPPPLRPFRLLPAPISLLCACSVRRLDLQEELGLGKRPQHLIELLLLEAGHRQELREGEGGGSVEGHQHAELRHAHGELVRPREEPANFGLAQLQHPRQPPSLVLAPVKHLERLDPLPQAVGNGDGGGDGDGPGPGSEEEHMHAADARVGIVVVVEVVLQLLAPHLVRQHPLQTGDEVRGAD